MDQPITYIGLDVHKDTIAVAHGLRLEIDQDQPSASTVRHTHYTSRPIAELDAPRLDNQCQGADRAFPGSIASEECQCPPRYATLHDQSLGSDQSSAEPVGRLFPRVGGKR
jgi:hypothetical protein